MQRRQSLGARVELFTGLAAANGIPTTDSDGVKMADVPGSGAISPNRCGAERHMLFIDMGNSGSAAFHIWGYQDAAWWVLGDYDGILNDGEVVVGTPRQRHAFTLRDLGSFERVYLEVATVSGTISATATIAEIVELS